jgi:hypothetical protein
MEKPIVIEDREELIFLLSEASQLEHMILCQYLFASFSLKQRAEEGLTDEQLAAVRRWGRTIAAVASQEMLHLALVTNLLSAVGGAPYFQHPNFPQRARYFPPGVQHALLPFGRDALVHFLHLECPDGMELPDAPEFAVLGPSAPPITGREVVPLAQDFATIGHFYREIERGFRHLVEQLGEARVFVGPPAAQATARDFGWPELIPVTDLASAVTAIETIVEEGEGAAEHRENSHYGRFLRIYQEYQELEQRDPGFEPARPVVAAAVRQPSDVLEAVPLIENPSTAAVADLFNAAYEAMLQILARFFLHDGETEAEYQTLRDASVQLMVGVIRPLGQLLTRLPVGADDSGPTAGPTFEVFRTGYLLPHRDAAWRLLSERLGELAADAERIAEPPTQEVLAQVSQRCAALARLFQPARAGILAAV